MSRKRLARHFRHIVDGYADLFHRAADTASLARSAPDISKWSVGQQLEHIALVDLAIVDHRIRACLGKPRDPADKGPSRPGWIVLFLGRVPRGRGRAPEQFHPQPPDAARIESNLQSGRQKWLDLEPDLDSVYTARAVSPHPRLGGLTPRQWVRFCQIHIDHHRAIADDILAATR